MQSEDMVVEAIIDDCVLCLLQYACGVTAEVVGKPSQAFFLSVLDSMGAKPEDVSGAPTGMRDACTVVA